MSSLFSPPWPFAVTGLVLLSAAASADTPATPTDLSPVVVTATRTERTQQDAPIRTEVVTRAELDRTHARTLKEAMENVPGVQLREIHGKSGFEASLQGLTSDQLLILIDGLPISASTGSTVDLSQYALTEVDRIEVIKGAASAQYGSAAMGGVINVITRVPESGLRVTALGDVGSYGTRNDSARRIDANKRHGQLQVDGGNQDWRWSLGADQQQDDGFSDKPLAWTRRGDAVERSQYSAMARWQPDGPLRAWGEVQRYEEDARQRYLRYVPSVLVPQQKDEHIRRDRLSGGARWSADNGLSLEAKGVTERYRSDSLALSQHSLVTQRDAKVEQSHLTLQVDLPPWAGQLWQVGVDLHDEQLWQNANGHSELSVGRAQRDSQELFLQNDVFLSERLELVLGARYQYDSDFGSHTAPKAALRYDYLQGDAWQGEMRASIGQGYRVPNLKERHFLFDHSALGYKVIGRPDLKPESSNSVQLGTSLRWQDQLTLDVNAFYNRITDLIQIDMSQPVTGGGGVTTYTYENIARAATWGVETGVQWTPLTPLTLGGSWTWTHTEDLDTGARLTRRPRHILRLNSDLTLPNQRTTLSLRARGQSRELTDTGQGDYSPSWHTWDVRLNHDATPALRLFAGIDNLFDRQRKFIDSTDPSEIPDFGPVAGRYVYLGARYQWQR